MGEGEGGDVQKREREREEAVHTIITSISVVAVSTRSDGIVIYNLAGKFFLLRGPLSLLSLLLPGVWIYVLQEIITHRDRHLEKGNTCARWCTRQDERKVLKVKEKISYRDIATRTKQKNIDTEIVRYRYSYRLDIERDYNYMDVEKAIDLD